MPQLVPQFPPCWYLKGISNRKAEVLFKNTLLDFADKIAVQYLTPAHHHCPHPWKETNPVPTKLYKCPWAAKAQGFHHPIPTYYWVKNKWISKCVMVPLERLDYLVRECRSEISRTLPLFTNSHHHCKLSSLPTNPHVWVDEREDGIELNTNLISPGDTWPDKNPQLLRGR